MPSLWPYLLLLVPAVFLVRDDFRTRTVSVVWLAVLCALSMGVGWSVAGLRQTLWYAAMNAGVLGVSGCAMLLCQMARRRPPVEFFNRSFGLGDAAMMFAVVPLFAPAAYVRFLLAACIVALGWWGVRRSATIPLAGFMALVLAVYAVSKTVGLWN